MVDLWIRSQNKKRLTKPNLLRIVKDDENTFTILSEDIGVELGSYKTEERAMAILDNIQTKLNTFLLDFSRWNYANIVYEMPQE